VPHTDGTSFEEAIMSKPTPNDQRSDTKNPNNDAYKANQDNYANQLNPNHAPTKSGNTPKKN
jgi:hypothetical protein